MVSRLFDARMLRDLEAALTQMNRGRYLLRSGESGQDHVRRAATLLGWNPDDPRFNLEKLLGSPDGRLAVYGSLAPGEKNHWVLKGMVGAWQRGTVRGELAPDGWGATEGFPGLVWDPRSGRIDVQLFSSDALPDHWDRIDRFEGRDYQRILVPVDLADGAVVVANIYEVAVRGRARR